MISPATPRTPHAFRLCSKAMMGALFLLAACVGDEDSPVHPSPDLEPPVAARAVAEPLATGLGSGAGSAVGPGGLLYVADNVGGRIVRVDPRSGEATTWVDGFPTPVLPVPLGGVSDVAFVGETAYALVTVVGPDVGGTDASGIYRIDGPGDFALIADLGLWSTDNPPATSFDLPGGVQWAIEPYRGGFLVSDGHHNRVLWVSTSGEIKEIIQLDNIVPTGLAVRGHRIWTSRAGPAPHAPGDGRILEFGIGSNGATEVASGAPLLLDVEVGRGNRLYGLAQGEWNGAYPGSPAVEDDGSLVRALPDGGFEVLASGLDRPTSFQIIRGNAYVVTLDGEVWEVRGSF